MNKLFRAKEFVNGKLVDYKVAMDFGERTVFYSPDLDLCFIKYQGDFEQVDCDEEWDELRETKYTVEW